MSIVAIKGVPVKWSLAGLYMFICKGAATLNGKFEMLNFDKARGDIKRAYLRVSEKLDPLVVVETLNSLSTKNSKLHFYVPKHVPDLPLASMKQIRGKQVQRPVRSADWIFRKTHLDILEEMQMKYRGLFDLSKKTGHKLLDEIAQTIFKRLVPITGQNTSSFNTFTLSQAYRTAHPHFADFQLILSTLHRLEDASGAPRTQLLEPELIGAVTEPQEIQDKLNKTFDKYATKVISKVSEHIDGLEVGGGGEGGAGDETKTEESQRRRVRQQLKNLCPHLPTIMKQVVTKVYHDSRLPTHFRLRMYGEPSLPSKETCFRFLREYKAMRIFKTSAPYNLMRFTVPIEQYARVMEADGTVLGDAKMTIRPVMPLEYRVNPELQAKMAVALTTEPKEDEFDFTDGEEWCNDVEI